MKTFALTIVGLIATAQAGFAQSTASWPPPAGIRVRVESPTFGKVKQIGTLLSAGADSIVLRPVDLTNSIALPTASVTRMEVATGRHTRRAKGALIGFVVAGSAGTAIAAATWKKPKPCMFCMDFGRWGDAAFIGGFSGILGAVGGFIVGSRATDSWEPVEVPRR
jgi:hypothetical protein